MYNKKAGNNFITGHAFSSLMIFSSDRHILTKQTYMFVTITTILVNIQGLKLQVDLYV